MKKQNQLSVCFLIFVLKMSFAFSQKPQNGLKIPVRDISYDTLAFKILNEHDIQSKRILINQYFLKAKKAKEIKHILKGYWFLTSVSDFKTAIKYTDTMISLSKTNYPEYVVKCYYKRGQIYQSEKKLKEALDFYLLAYNNLDNDDVQFKNKVSYAIGDIRSSQGNYEQALAIFLNYKEFLSQNNKLDANIIYVIAEMYLKLNKINESVLYTNEGFEFCKSNNDNLYYNYFISNRGKIFYKKKQYSNAISDLKSSLKYFKEEAQDFSNYAENCFYIGKSHLSLHEKQLAHNYFIKVDSIFTAEGDIYPDMLESYPLIIDYFKSENDYKNALFYTDQFIKADSTVTANYKYLTDKLHKDYDIPEIIYSKQTIIKRMENEKLFSFYAIIVLTSFLFIVLIIFYKYIRKRKTDFEKQKKEFENFMTMHTQKSHEKIELKNNTVSTDNSILIDQKIIDQTLLHLEKFVADKKFLKFYTVEILAKEFNTNSKYLSTIINDYMGFSFPTYVNNLRIDYVIEKLQNESKFRNYTIIAISEEGGYNNVQSFARAFVARTNMKPSFFIKELKNRYK